MSTPGDGWPTEPPAWLGDIAAGVDAWTQRADEAPKSRPARTARHTPSEEKPRTASRGRGSRRSGAGDQPRRRRSAPPEDTATAVPEADPESVARKILLDQLTGAARSRAELRKKLDAKDVPEELSEQLLDRFTEVGLIDDQALAEAWVTGRQRAKGLAPRAIAQELRRKGIDDETAREALDLIDEESQREAARELVRKKVRSLRRVDRTTATRRLVSMLARKGYGGGLAFAVVKEELAGAEFTDDGVEFPDPEW